MGVVVEAWMGAAEMVGRKPAAEPRSGLVKRVWLLLYTEGGTWSASEIRQKLRLIGEISIVLQEMVDRGLVIRKPGTTDDGTPSVHYQYCITRRCKVPRGVTVDELWDVLQMAVPKAGKVP